MKRIGIPGRQSPVLGRLRALSTELQSWDPAEHTVHVRAHAGARRPSLPRSGLQTGEQQGVWLDGQGETEGDSVNGHITRSGTGITVDAHTATQPSKALLFLIPVTSKAQQPSISIIQQESTNSH